ncbi:MAG: cytochrome c3 family protein [Deltaproteobacteria bacterium]|nr:cytochrome c3 family protein [Deltaproteobacteria bacterium]
MKKITFTIACIILITAISGLCHARVTGECSNCHTMHNSQGGTDIGVQTGYASTSGAKASLLRANGCLGCHATTGSGWTGVGGAPIVYNTTGVTYGDSQPDGYKVGLAGGNFYYLSAGGSTGTPPGTLPITSQSRGHSLSGIPYVDDTTTPEWNRGSCTLGCHQDGLKTQGCKACHVPAHHKGASSGGWADAGAGYYRFLGPIPEPLGSDQHEWGVRGYEDPDWQAETSSSNHNEYSGEAPTTGYHSISRHCIGCHDGGSYPDECPVFEAATEVWHTATMVLPTTYTKWDGYRGYAGVPPSPYSPLLPIARKNITSYTSPSAAVTHGGNDTLMCLTCHRAHASPYNKMLRWDNSLAWGELPSESCKGCHKPY